MVVIEDILIAASVELKNTIDHEFYLGTEGMVSKKLEDVDPANRYPLIAIATRFNETTDNGGYVSFTLQRIVFGALATTTKTAIERISDTGNFKTILYPLYENYLRILCNQPQVIQRDWRVIEKTKRNIYGEVPATDKVADVLDAIEILNFKNKIDPALCG